MCINTFDNLLEKDYHLARKIIHDLLLESGDRMEARASLKINASKEAVWAVICDIENADKNISGINKVEILDQPKDGIVGLKWRETRTMFGKEATEVMWVTDAETNKYYRTRAESHGAIYISTMSIEDRGDTSIISMGFEGEAVTFGAKVGNFIFGKMMLKSTEKALMVDLEDIKKVVEAK